MCGCSTVPRIIRNTSIVYSKGYRHLRGKAAFWIDTCSAICGVVPDSRKKMLHNTLARFCFGCAAAIGLLTLAIPARADVPLYNAGFEIQNPFDQAAGCGSPTPCYNFSIIGWSQHGSSGTFDPTLGVPPIAPPAHEGKNVAWLSSGVAGGSYIAQDLGDLTAGDYSITVWVASRGPAGPTPPALYRLGVGNGGNAATPTWASVYQTSGTAPGNLTSTSDNWAKVTLSFTLLANSGDWYAFVADDGAVAGGSAQLLVDTPEASALLLLIMMITCLALFRPKSARFE